jgi:hypothetical protein
MANEKTGKKAGKNASKVLRNPKQDEPSKSAAGSALTQRPAKKAPAKKAPAKKAPAKKS